ncbi:hypothetical protein Lfu02_00320 [Longispora fulva]|uniref:Uncharacterized protein n=1 Tax=Longispora fulva TaxID=619741 RepID=A0A8J7KFE8_9ACTN|nr:hypothetical protein [Longispora fulva]MBG6136095.1 hypothetical protein [Longispora fulva]GIG55660.1 hypothetical protein Lfu02_00320 [Longispora fulva]
MTRVPSSSPRDPAVRQEADALASQHSEPSVDMSMFTHLPLGVRITNLVVTLSSAEVWIVREAALQDPGDDLI